MKFAILDGALMGKANFDRANLDGADLARATLRGANLPVRFNGKRYARRCTAGWIEFAQCEPGANRCQREPTSKKADLRKRPVGSGNILGNADFRGAYLWSTKLPGADLGGGRPGTAIPIDADLRGVNLSGAPGFNEVRCSPVRTLSGADLDGADFAGPRGLTAQQVCLTKSRYGVLLDEALLTQVESQCGRVR